MSIQIDKACEYIESKNATYLAKEGLIVFFTSITGRKSDQIWVKHSMAETIRIIRATRLSTDCELKEAHVLAAFQELGRVYEYGVKSRHTVADGVFNYYANANTSLANQVAINLVDAILMRNLKALLCKDVFGVYSAILTKLGESNPTSDSIRNSLLSALSNVGFEHKTGSRRVLYNNTKINVFMMPKAKPSQIILITGEIFSQIVTQVYGELK